MFRFEYLSVEFLATISFVNLGLARALPPNQDDTMIPSTDLSASCSANYDGQFGLLWTDVEPDGPPFVMDCSDTSSNTVPRSTLTDGIIRFTGSDGTEATIVLKNDGTIGALSDVDSADDVTSSDGFAICDDGYVRLGDTDLFWQCLQQPGETPVLKIQDEGNCRPVKPRILPCKEKETVDA